MKSSQISQLDRESRARVWGALLALTTCLAFVFWALSEPKIRSSAERQSARAQSLAYQVLEIKKQQLKSRGPASVDGLADEGQLGLGDDGHPYQYRLREDGSQWVVQVWNESNPGGLTEVRIRKDQL